MSPYDPSRPDPQLPDGLREALRRADLAGAVPTPEVDAVIEAAARRHFRTPRRRLVLRLAVPLGAVAAGLAALFTIYPHVRNAGTNASVPRGPQPQLTILDAFALARQLKTGSAPDAGWDYSGDGVVDLRDVDALAQAAVSLEGRS